MTHLIDCFEKDYDQKVSNIVILQSTSPLRNSLHMKEAMILMQEKLAKAIVSVCELEYPIQFCNKISSNSSMDNFIEPQNMKRTQDLETYFRLNGALYFLTRDYVSYLSKIYSEGAYSYIMNPQSSVDIDNEDDFRLASYYIGLVI